MPWEYSLIRVPSGRGPLDDSNFKARLRKAGQAGWELISIESGVGYFKRSTDGFEPVEEEEEETPPPPPPPPPVKVEADEDEYDDPFDPGDIDNPPEDDDITPVVATRHFAAPLGHDPEKTGVI